MPHSAHNMSFPRQAFPRQSIVLVLTTKNDDTQHHIQLTQTDKEKKLP